MRFWQHLVESLEDLKTVGASGFCGAIIHFKGDMEAYRDLGILNYAANLDTCCWSPSCESAVWQAPPHTFHVGLCTTAHWFRRRHPETRRHHRHTRAPWELYS